MEREMQHTKTNGMQQTSSTKQDLAINTYIKQKEVSQKRSILILYLKKPN